MIMPFVTRGKPPWISTISLKEPILDAVDEGLIKRDPTRKAIIKGKTPREKKPKYLNQFELHTALELKPKVGWDWFILLSAKMHAFPKPLP